jgi:hypothetical protein
MSIPADRRTTKDKPCPGCGHPRRHRYGHCFFLEGHEAVWCANVTSLNGVAGIPTGSGWVHRIVAPPRPTLYTTRRPAPSAVPVDFAPLARRFTRACTPGPLNHLAGKLGVSTVALRRLRVGWAVPTPAPDGRMVIPGTTTPAPRDGVWTFPMSNGCIRPTAPIGDIIGIRTRTVRGDKFSVTGSIGDGLFIPTGMGEPHTILAPEGPTSCAALLQLGFAAVGRPNNRAGAVHFINLIRRLRPRRVVVLGDNDQRPSPTGGVEWPGMEGAEAFAQDVVVACRALRITLAVSRPPDGIKDARHWLAAGATVAAVHRIIESSTIVTSSGIAGVAGRRSA